MKTLTKLFVITFVKSDDGNEEFPVLRTAGSMGLTLSFNTLAIMMVLGLDINKDLAILNVIVVYTVCYIFISRVDLNLLEDDYLVRWSKLKIRIVTVLYIILSFSFLLSCPFL